MKHAKQAKRELGAASTAVPSTPYLLPLRELFPPLVARRALFVALALVAAILFIYAQTRNFDFVNLDDPEYVPGNPHVRTGLTWSNLRWSLTSGYAANWFPLTWASHMLDVEIFGVSSGWHHLTNVALHAGSTVMLLLFLYVSSGSLWRSALMAALFAVHPMRVESVAWVAERKDVLSTFLWMLTLGAYIAYLRKPGARRYAALLLAFVLGLMSKPMLVTLPFVLLLFDVWPLRRVQLSGGKTDFTGVLPLVKEKFPLFAAVVGSSLITYLVQSRGGSVSMTADFPMSMRISNALLAYVRYIGKMFWPVDLAAFYPFNQAIPTWQIAGSLALLIAVSAAALAMVKTRPHVFVGWFMFVGTLVPVIGLVKIGSHSIADRYTYIPYVGLFILIAWSLPAVAQAGNISRMLLPSVAGIVLVALTLLSRAQAATWKDSITLWTHAARAVENNAEAYSNLGTVLMEQGKLEEANTRFKEALRMNPNLVHAHSHYGAALLKQGKLNEAGEHLRVAQRLNPNLSDVEGNLGVAAAANGNYAEAITHYEKALSIDPAYADAYTNWGLALANQGNLMGATEKFRTAVQLRPDSPEAHNNLGAALARSGDNAGAIAELQEAVRLKPSEPDWLVNVAILLLQQNDRSGARENAERALRLNPDNVRARKLLDSLGLSPAP